MADLLIDGRWVAAAEGRTREIRCPADGTLVAVVDEAGPEDTVAAIEAARRAFDDGPWRHTAATERSAMLGRTADILERETEAVARAESLDTGKRIVEARYDVADVVKCFRYFAGAAQGLSGRLVETGDPTIVSRIAYEPVGVCGLITPWNYPLLQASWKVAPALAAGNAFVIKPSELTPSTTILLMRYLVEAGLPDGVGNLVLGAGPEAGAPLSEHAGVDLVSFTGGLVTGRRVMAAAAGTVKKVALELGGKNPNIVFADADLDAALDNALTAVFLHSGQVCSAGARLIVEESIHDTFVDALVQRAGRIRLGGPYDEDAETGTLISAAHQEKVQRYVDAAVAEGAVLRCGGTPPDDPALAGGHYFLPTVLDGCVTAMGCVQDESFGPVLTVETFRTEDEAVRIANDTMYGLAGAVWSSDASRVQRVAGGLRHGTIWINDYHPYLPQAEWGGFKQSGVGRELGPTGLHEYLEAKHVYQNLNPAPSGWFAGALVLGGDGMSQTGPVTSDTSAAISVRSLWKVFGPSADKVVGTPLADLTRKELLNETGCVAAVRDVSFDVAPGEVFVVMGLSGSGKSTLVRCLTRLIEPTAGSVLVSGEDILKASPSRLRELRRTQFSMVFQHFGLLPHRKVIDNIAYSLEINGVKKEARHKRANEVIELVGLHGYGNSYPEQLSGGMQQRVGLARALAVDPKVMFLDEPFSALDPLIRRDMQAEVMRLHRDLGKTMVFITHDLAEAMKVGDRIAIMRDGAVVQMGTPEELVADPADDYVADFTRDIPKSHVLCLHAIARPAVDGEDLEGPELDGGMVIRDATPTILEARRPVKVVQDGRLLGVVTPDDVLRLISGDVAAAIEAADAAAVAHSGEAAQAAEESGSGVGAAR